MKHLVVTVPGGPLAALYGTPQRSAEQFLAEVKEVLVESKAETIEFLCVDPKTDGPLTPKLNADLSGFADPAYKGNGWNAVLTEQEPKNIASFHQYCASECTNHNHGQWRELSDHMEQALKVLNETFGEFVSRIHKKEAQVGSVPQEVQDKVLCKH